MFYLCLPLRIKYSADMELKKMKGEKLRFWIRGYQETRQENGRFYFYSDPV